MAFATAERLQFSLFPRDSQRIGRGVVVGSGNWEQQLDQNKRDYFDEFVSRRVFTDSYPQLMNAAQFIDALNLNAGGALSSSERAAFDYRPGLRRETRAQCVRAIAEHATFIQTQFNRAFGLMQYFGYLPQSERPAGHGFRGIQCLADKTEPVKRELHRGRDDQSLHQLERIPAKVWTRRNQFELVDRNGDCGRAGFSCGKSLLTGNAKRGRVSTGGLCNPPVLVISDGDGNSPLGAGGC